MSKPQNKCKVNDRLSVKSVPFPWGPCSELPPNKVSLLALDGEVIPGQCSIGIESNSTGITKVHVIFEVRTENVPEELR